MEAAVIILSIIVIMLLLERKNLLNDIKMLKKKEKAKENNSEVQVEEKEHLTATQLAIKQTSTILGVLLGIGSIIMVIAKPETPLIPGFLLALKVSLTLWSMTICAWLSRSLLEKKRNPPKHFFA